MTLRTGDVPAAASGTGEAAGFVLVGESGHRGPGRDPKGRIWTKDLSEMKR